MFKIVRHCQKLESTLGCHDLRNVAFAQTGYLFTGMCWLSIIFQCLANSALAVRSRNYFSKYSEQARAVLNALLDKYADEGIENIQSLSVLNVKPISELGTPVEIIKHFGSKQKYLDALRELETQIYTAA